VDNGDFGDIGKTLIILIPLILLILFNIFFRRRKGERTQPEIAISLLSEVALNQQIAEAFLQKAQVKKFRTDSWQRNREKLDFLDQKLQDELAKTFNMAEEFNRAADDARKFKSSSYLLGVPVDKLKESLARSRQGLEQWFEANKDQAMMMPGRRGCLGP
jgi:hypothetical protein